MLAIIMEKIEDKIKRISRIPGVLNWARQNFSRTDKTAAALKKLADAKITVSLNPVYNLCAKLAYREITFDSAFSKASGYEGFLKNAASEILPLFQDYLVQNQVEAVPDFKEFRVPFPIGSNIDGKVASIPVRPTFVYVRDGRLRPIFLLGWVDTPLDYHQRRLISAIIRRAILTQQDFLGSDAEIVTFPRIKGTKQRYQGGWNISSFPDLSDEELSAQFSRYNKALQQVIKSLTGNL